MKKAIEQPDEISVEGMPAGAVRIATELVAAKMAVQERLQFIDVWVKKLGRACSLDEVKDLLACQKVDTKELPKEFREWFENSSSVSSLIGAPNTHRAISSVSCDTTASGSFPTKRQRIG